MSDFSIYILHPLKYCSIFDLLLFPNLISYRGGRRRGFGGYGSV